jgi:hypothetical protein
MEPILVFEVFMPGVFDFYHLYDIHTSDDESVDFIKQYLDKNPGGLSEKLPFDESNVLDWAIVACLPKTVAFLLEKEPKLLLGKTTNGRTPLDSAIQHFRSLSIVSREDDKAIRAGVKKEKDKHTEAAKESAKTILKQLLECCSGSGENAKICTNDTFRCRNSYAGTETPHYCFAQMMTQSFFDDVFEDANITFKRLTRGQKEKICGQAVKLLLQDREELIEIYGKDVDQINKSFSGSYDYSRVEQLFNCLGVEKCKNYKAQIEQCFGEPRVESTNLAPKKKKPKP